MITHRPPPDLLLSYAAGALPEHLGLAIAAHAALSPDSQREIARLESVGGALLDELAPTTLGRDALERTLAALDETTLAARPMAVTEETRRLLPAPLWRYVDGDVRKLDWRHVGKGIATARPVRGTAGENGFFLRVPAGRHVAQHTHRGIELTLVLSGAYYDGRSHFKRGDIQVTDATIDHRPQADAGEECLCFVALEAPIRLTGPIGRLVSPLVRL
jgi:putative transcriptional regulator